MKIKAATKEFIVECQVRGYTDRTLKSYRNNLNTFTRYCEEVENISELEDINMAVIKGFTSFFLKNGKKATYINGMLKGVKSFLQYHWTENGEGMDTRKGFRWVKEERPVIRAFNKADIKKILGNCKGNDYLSIRDNCIITMFFETGIRNLELCTIKPSDIFDDYIIINGKNHKQRFVAITPILKKAMIRYERARDSYFALKRIDDYYFLSYRHKQMTVEAIEHVLKQRGKGITDIRVSPHTCRHTWAQQQVKMGTDIYTISRLMGHQNVRITQIYLNSLTNEELVKMNKNKSVLMHL